MIDWEKHPKHKDELGECAIRLKDKDGFFDVTAKFDGCVDIVEYDCVDGNGNPINEEPSETIHICCLDLHIKRLISLQKYCRAHFKNDEWLKDWEA